MPAYLGHLGALAPITLVSSTLGVAAERPATYKTTLGGVKHVHLGRRVHREWDVTAAAALPHEVAQVAAFVEGEFGVGPWWWLDPRAQVTNVLPPRVAALEQRWQGTTPGGPVALPDGSRAGRSLIVDGGGATVQSVPGTDLRLPVVAGVPVTASAWVSSAGQEVRVTVRDADSQSLGTSTGGTTGVDGLARAATTIVPPTGAHHALVRFVNPGRVVRPAVTWTSGARVYGPGAGCESAVITGVDTEMLRLISAQSRELASFDFSVTEVG